MNKLAKLLGTASVISIACALGAQAQEQTAQVFPDAVPEQVLVTGSLIHGTTAVGVPITSLGTDDFKEVGALTVSDVLKTVPSVLLLRSSLALATGLGSPAALEGHQGIQLHGVGGNGVPGTLMLIDGMRFPLQGSSPRDVDPSIIPQLALSRLDVLADGASATYGSDATVGVINVILKRGFEGAVSQFRVADSTGMGGLAITGSQLYGTHWSGGDITLTYEYTHIDHVQGPGRSYNTYDFSPWGLSNQTPLIASVPGIVSTGAPALAPGAPSSGFSASSGANCGNCYSVPKGQNGVGLTWASLLANKGTTNEINPNSLAWFEPDVQRNAAVVTFDQDLWKSDGLIREVQFYGDAFYNHQRNVFYITGLAAPVFNAYTLNIPTTNPYYPIGAPSGLRVAYDFGVESPAHVSGGSLAARYQGGFNLTLSGDWFGKAFFQQSTEHDFDTFSGLTNSNRASAAVGNTVAAFGVFPGYTKPANIPYLNMFCDATSFKQCNDPATVAYITGNRVLDTKTIINEVGATFDGPLIDLPGGTVKLALGADYFTSHFSYYQSDASTSQQGRDAPNVSVEPGHYNVWAIFGQLNVPLVGEGNALPLVEKLDLEVSGRLDHYSTVGTTTNPKIGLNWTVGQGVTLRGSWGTSFRAPAYQEVSAVAGTSIQPINIAAGNSINAKNTCPVVGGHATPGSLAALLDPNCTAALQNIGGVVVAGGSGGAAPIRGPGFVLQPETAANWAAGVDFAPTEFLKGFDASVTYYDIKISNVIRSVSQGTGLDDPVALADGNLIPKTDPNFAAMLAGLQKEPIWNPSIIPANVQYIQVNSNNNSGWDHYQGIDFTVSYDWDMGNLGAWNTGLTGNYIVGRKSFNSVGTPVVDYYATGFDSGGRLKLRGRLGWAGGENNEWSVTGFVNYRSHVGGSWPGSQTQALPPSCFLAGNTPCSAGGGVFAQYNQQFPTLSNNLPSIYTFDLSIGYNTGERPANKYLRNVGLQLTVNNILDKPPLFNYKTSTNGGPPVAFDTSLDPAQRYVVFQITKTW